MRFIFIFFILVFFTNCKANKFTQKEQQPVLSVLSPINEFNPKIWYDKDLNVNQIPGISLNKWYKENKKPKKRSVTVAVIDTQIDTNHEELLNTFWINKGEIPNNNIDDDKNGYIDDINGWNFIGTKEGSTVWANFEFVRIVRDYDKLYNGKKTSDINKTELPCNNEYHRSIKKLEQEKGFYANWLKSLKYNLVKFPIAKDSLKRYFPKEDYSYQQLDSMYKKYKINDKTYMQRRDDDDRDLGALVDFMMAQFEVNQKNLSDIQVKEKEIDSIVNRNLNVSYDERTFFDLNPDVLEKGYGNNNISSNLAGRTINNHCTMVSGIIASNRANLIGINGISNNIKLMPLSISPSGDEHDKDIAMAIRYAVDNGAKVINMSFGKEFSLHKEWLEEAFKYAEQHNVLLVHSAGNNSFNVDVNPYYPTDISYEGSSKEVCGNFISVGATTAKIDSTLVASFSNYGKNNVDLFAPGDQIYTTKAGNSYGYDSGTSLAAPMVSGTAALIWSYYPKLSVQQVKQIILESGTAYDIEVLVPGGEGKKVKFSELSKSGKVLNVYNAMQLAEKVSKKKRY